MKWISITLVRQKARSEFHRRDAEFAEIEVFLEQELFTLCRYLPPT